jgi:4-hydroxy-tetrahydrodipicolinate synthase
MNRPSGVIPNMVVPMDADGHPRPDGIKSLVEFLVGAGVGGLWVLGSAGEDVNISHADRIVVANETARAVGRRVPVVVGLGPSSFHDIMAFARQADVDRIDGFHYLPYDLKLGDEGLQRYVTKLADALPRPLWLYHNPKRGRPVTLELARRLRDHPNVAGIKVGGYSLTELTRMMMLRRDDFEVSGAGGGQMYQMLCLGARLHMTSDANCYPEVYVELLKHFQEGRHAEALALQHRLIGLSASLPRTDNGEYSAEEKYVLSLRGVIDDNVNPAYRKLNEAEKTRTRSLLREFGFAWAQ